jgi:glycosyltransferase involved in cell wall biosynthesis
LLGSHLRRVHGNRVAYAHHRWLPSERSERWVRKPPAPHRLTIVVVTYRQLEALKCLLASLNCQTLRNFDVLVIHDGRHDATRHLVERSAADYDFPCQYLETDERFDDYGHSLRKAGIRSATGEFLLITNGDNYYSPRFVEFVFEAIDLHHLDIAMWDIVHSHSKPGLSPLPSYSPFSISPVRYCVDIGAFLVRTSMAKKAGFRARTLDADATYFEDLVRAGTATGVRVAIGKIEKTLMVHN